MPRDGRRPRRRRGRSPELRRASPHAPDSTASLAATFAGFVALGLFWGAWAAVLPDVQDATGASNGLLGAALLFVSVGSVPTMLLLAGPAVDRYGTRAVAVFCATFAAATLLPGLVSSVETLALALVLTGAASGALDVGINARAARYEEETGRRVMPAAHGLYSVGVLAGAVSAGFARSAGAGRETVLAGVAVLVAASAVAFALEAPRRPRRAPVTPGSDTVTEVSQEPGFPSSGAASPGVRPRFERALLALGLVGAAAFLVEGGVESWSALFLENRLDAPPSVSGLGPGVFGAAMAVGRFGGQAAAGVSGRRLLSGGAAVASVGCVLVAASGTTAAALAGFALAGAGISLAAPVVFGAAGRGRANAASAVATATTLGYLGLLVGPPLVGAVAQLTSLAVSFLVLAAVAAAVAAAAARLRVA